MNSTIKITLALCVLILMTGCATLFSESNYPVRIESNPPQMEIAIVDRQGQEIYRGKTPSLVSLKAASGYFRPAQYTIKLYRGDEVVGTNTFYGSIDGWYFLNIFDPFLISQWLGMLVIDPATSSMWRLDKNVMVNEK